MNAEIKRKLFHLSGLVYAAGIFFLPRLTFLIILSGVAVFTAGVEWLRLKNPVVQLFFEKHFGGLFRDHERTRMTGVFWMMLGVLCAALLLKQENLVMACILYLILGDGVASIAGKKLKTPKIPRSEKTWGGSIACFLMCMAIGVFLILPFYGWLAVVIGAGAATIFEAGYLPLDDNLTVPAGSALVFWAVLALGII